MSLFGDDPALKQPLTRDGIQQAYAEELREHPPVNSCAGDTEKARSARSRYAKSDCDRFFAAARRAGFRVEFKPLFEGEKGKDNG